MVLSTDRGDRAILTHPGTIPTLDVEGVDRGILEAARHVHVSSYFLQRSLAPDLSALLEDVHASGATTSLDPNWDPEEAWDGGLDRVLSRTDVFLPNETEAVRIARADDLPKKGKLKWAKIASEQNLSPVQLKASIAAGEVVDVAAARQQRHGIISIHGIRQEVDIWLNRVGGIEGILKMDKPHQDEILELIEPIANLYSQIKGGTKKKSRKKKADKKAVVA